jgi:hypothetical protein
MLISIREMSPIRRHWVDEGALTSRATGDTYVSHENGQCARAEKPLQ